MDKTATIQLIGGLRLGAADDESFYGNLFARLPKEVRNTGRLTRYVAFDYLTDGQHSITFLGIEVERIEHIPAGLMAWVLDTHSLSVFEVKNGKHVIIWQEEVTWLWRDDSVCEGHQRITGEFTVRVPSSWSGTDEPARRDFSMTGNIYTAPGQTGPDDRIHLVEYDPTWPHRFREFSASLVERLGPDIALKIEHHGSTSIPGMPAKPIIDMLVVVPSFSAAKHRVLPLLNCPTWEYVWYHNHMVFIKRDTLMGVRTHHVHMMPECPMFQKYLAFRDFLRSHADDAARYTALKQQLAKSHPKNANAIQARKAILCMKLWQKRCKNHTTHELCWRIQSTRKLTPVIRQLNYEIF